MTSCSSYEICDSLWCNFTTTQAKGETATVVNGMYLTKDKKVLMRTAVVKDSTILHNFAITGYGTYEQKGSNIIINTEVKLDEPAKQYKGIVTKNNTMILCSQDSMVYVYDRVFKTVK